MAVQLGVVFSGLIAVEHRPPRVVVRDQSFVRGMRVILLLVVLGCLAMMFRSLLMMTCGQRVVFGACVLLEHDSSRTRYASEVQSWTADRRLRCVKTAWAARDHLGRAD
jgi:hypothetical protein